MAGSILSATDLIPLTLGMRFSNRAQRSECARFIPGTNHSAWLRELLAWEIPLDSVCLCPLPQQLRGQRLQDRVEADSREAADTGPQSMRSRGEESCLGVLATFDAELKPRITGRSQPYGVIANQIYLPVEAQLSLDLNEREWEGLSNLLTAVSVWHPQTGLVGFEASEMLRVVDLLARPSQSGPVDSNTTSPQMQWSQSQNWGQAQHGVSFTSRIRSLRVDLPPSVESMLSDGRDDIGTETKPLPPPGLSSESLKHIGKMAAGAALAPFALMKKLLSSMAPSRNAAPLRDQGSSNSQGGNSQPGPLSKFWNWLTSKSPQGSSRPPNPVAQGNSESGPGLVGAAMQSLSQFMKWTAELMDARQREVNRLLKLLRDNPDEGLKYALPMGGEPGRGIARPSSSLLQRQIDFSLGGRGGSGPADVWNLPAETQMELVRRYRDLAAREIQLGRYRRAAYIFAELLGDVNAAAQALVSGRFYREAAVLYRDKLKRPLDAANCLENGGLIQEAIPLYRAAGQIEKVGDLYQRLEESENAAAAFREAVQLSLNRSDYLDAARILEAKLKSEEEALAVLDSGWPGSSQAKRCLEVSYELRTRLGRHEDTLKKIAELKQSELAPQRFIDAVEVLTNVAVQSPHALTRSNAADTVRVMVSKGLAGNVAGKFGLANALSRMVPQDRLLARDSRRAVLSVGVKNRRANDAPQSLSQRVPKQQAPWPRRIRIFQLPVGVRWQAACGTDKSFYITGWLNEQDVFVARGAWSDPNAGVSSVVSDRDINMSESLLICRPPGEGAVIVANTAARVFTEKTFVATDANSESEMVTTPSWLPSSVSGLAVSPIGTVFVFHQFEMEIRSFPISRNSTRVCDVDLPLMDRTMDPDEVFPMVAQDDVCYLGVDRYLVAARTGQNPMTQSYSVMVRRLVVSPPQTEPRLLVLFDRGGYMYWTDRNLSESRWLCDALSNPFAVFLRDGRLVLLGESMGQRVWQIYTTNDWEVQFVRQEPCDVNAAPIALLRAGAPNQVGLCTEDGKVRLYDFT